jgi:hypothetical protein
MPESTPVEPTTEPTATVEPTAPATEPVDWQGKYEAQLKINRKLDQRAKDNFEKAQKWDEYEATSATELEKATKKAREEGRAEALRESGSRLVDAEVRAAAAGRDIDVATLLEGLDRSRFLDDDGNPDTAAIAAWIDKLAPKADGGFVDIGQGERGTQASKSSDPVAQMLALKLGIPNP